MKAYYIHNGRERSGPFSISDLQKKEINPDTLIWYKGLAEWTMAAELEELRYIIQATPPKIKDGLQPPPIANADMTLPPQKKRSSKLVWFVLLMLLAAIAGIWLYKDRNNSFEGREKQEQTEKQEELAAADKTKIRNNIRRYVTVKRSKYNSAQVGGISDLSITVINNTRYLIDEVKVEIHYIKSNDEIYATEYLDFSLIGPHAKMTLKAPDSKRGVRVEQTIVEVKSKDLGL